MKLQRREILSEIPTSSTADIAFLLVVFFMMTMTFSAQRGLDLPLPEEEEETRLIEPVEAVDVLVLASGALKVDGRGMSIDRLLPYLRPRLEQDPRKPVILRVADDAAYGPMVVVLDELRKGRGVLALEDEIQVAIPTRRELEMYWPASLAGS